MTEPWLPKDEYAALQEELRDCTAQLAQLERTCVIGTAAIFAWLATNAEGLVGFAGLVWAVPVLIASYGCLKARALYRRIGLARGYLKELEVQAAAGDRWHAYFARKWRMRGLVSGVAWFAFLGFVLVGSSFGYLQFRMECPGPLPNACAQQDEGGDTQGEEQESLKQGT